jgi:signal peptidase I
MKVKNYIFPLFVLAVPLLLILCFIKPLSSCYRTFTLIGGSMDPAIKTGSLILVRAVNPEELEPGDIITFRNSSHTKVITHRVIAVERAGVLRFTTRGDANSANDFAPVFAADVIGKVLVVIPYMGSVIYYSRNYLLHFLLLTVPAVLVLIPWRIRPVRKLRWKRQ